MGWNKYDVVRKDIVTVIMVMVMAMMGRVPDDDVDADANDAKNDDVKQFVQNPSKADNQERDRQVDQASKNTRLPCYVI